MRHTRLYYFALIGAVTLAVLSACGEKNYESLLADGKNDLSKQNYDDALISLRKAYVLNPSARDVLLNLGMAYEGAKKVDSAITYYKQTLSLYGADQQVARRLVDVAESAENWDVVIHGMTKLVEAGVPNSSLMDKFYEIYMRAGYLELALEAARQSLSENLDDVKKHARFAETYRLSAFDDSALVALDSAEKKFGPRREFYATRGAVYASTRRHVLAEAQFRLALGLDSSSSASWVNLGHSLASQDAQEKKWEAIECYGRVDHDLSQQMRLDTIIARLKTELGRPDSATNRP